MSRNEVNEVTGQFATIELTLNQVEQIATASSIKGSIGGVSLNFGSSVQSGFQKLLQKVRQGGAGQRPSGTHG